MSSTSRQNPPIWSVDLCSHDDANYYDILDSNNAAVFVSKSSISVLRQPIAASSDGRIVERNIEDQSNDIICACLVCSPNHSHATVITSSNHPRQGWTLSWWNIQSGELIARTQAFKYSVSRASMNLCSSSHSLLAASNGFTISIFGSAGEAICNLPSFIDGSVKGSASTIEAMSWNNKNILFAAVRNIGKTRIISWNVDSSSSEMQQNHLNFNLPDSSILISQMIFSSDGQLLAALSETRVLIWSIESVSEDKEGLPRHIIERSNKKALCFAWAEGQAMLAVSFGRDLILWVESTPVDPDRVNHEVSNYHQLVYEKKEADVCSVAFQKNGHHLAALCDDGRLLIYDTRHARLKLHESRATQIINSFRPSKLLFCTGGGERSLVLVAHGKGIQAYYIDQATQIPSEGADGHESDGSTRLQRIGRGQDRGRNQGYAGRGGGRGRGASISHQPSRQEGWQHSLHSSTPQSHPYQMIPPMGGHPAFQAPLFPVACSQMTHPSQTIYQPQNLSNALHFLDPLSMYPQPGTLHAYYPAHHMMPRAYPVPYSPPLTHYGQDTYLQPHFSAHSFQSFSILDSSMVPTPEISCASTPRIGSFESRSNWAESGGGAPPPPPPPLPAPAGIQSASDLEKLLDKGHDGGSLQAPQSTLPSVTNDDNDSNESPPSFQQQRQLWPLHHHEPTSRITRYPQTTVYVGNLTPYIDEATLFNSFIQFGFISQVQIIRNKETGAHKGYGFVTYVSSTSGAAAIAYMHGCRLTGPFQGIKLRVSSAHHKVRDTHHNPGINPYGLGPMVKNPYDLGPMVKSAAKENPDEVDVALLSINTLTISSGGPLEPMVEGGSSFISTDRDD